MTFKCVDHLIMASEEAKIPTQIIVVDNSANETSKMLKKILPDKVEIIENSVNFGFAKANNQGIIQSKGKYVLLLNNDAFVTPECLKEGLNYFDNHNNVGIWAPKLIGEDDAFQVSCARLPSIKGLFGEYILFRNFDWYDDVLEWREPRNVGSVVGAFMLAETNLVKKIGLLDEDFFFTVEDVDYCNRVHKAGLKVIYDPRYTVIHIGSASQDDKWVDDPNLHKYRVLYFRKNQGKLNAFLASIIIKLGLKIRKIKAA